MLDGRGFPVDRYICAVTFGNGQMSVPPGNRQKNLYSLWLLHFILFFIDVLGERRFLKRRAFGISISAPAVQRISLVDAVLLFFSFVLPITVLSGRNRTDTCHYGAGRGGPACQPVGL